MVGASAGTNRPSYFAMKYLLGKGYRVIPVNPTLAGKEILGQRVYASLAEVPAPVDIVDIFRNSAAALEVVREAIRLKDGSASRWCGCSSACATTRPPPKPRRPACRW